VNGFEKHGIDHLSASSINLWRNAPDKWVADKILGLPRHTSPTMERGNCVEDALVAILAHGEDFTEAIEEAEARFDRAFPIGDQRTTKNRNMIGPMVHLALPLLMPLGPVDLPEQGRQHKVEINCNVFGRFKIRLDGYLDFVFAEHGLVVDLKTTERMPTVMSYEHQVQRAIYARCKDNHQVRFLYVTPQKAEWREDGDAALLDEIKAHVDRQEAFLALGDAETLRRITPVNLNSFYWSGQEEAGRELYGLPARPAD
jgi:hypothetical protein